MQAHESLEIILDADEVEEEELENINVSEKGPTATVKPEISEPPLPINQQLMKARK
jgi:hypothetical protein